MFPNNQQVTEKNLKGIKKNIQKQLTMKTQSKPMGFRKAVLRL